MDFYDPETTPKYHLYNVFWSLDGKLYVLKSVFTASNSVCSSLEASDSATPRSSFCAET